MTFTFKTFSLEDTYLPISQRLTIDEKNDRLFLREAETIPFPVTDGSILDATIRFYVTHPHVKMNRSAATALGVDKRDLSSAIHLLTGMNHDEFLRQYRLRAILEVINTTTLSVLTIAKFFGYASIHSLNRFLTDQTRLTANEIRDKRDATEKKKRGSWMHAPDLDTELVTSRNL